MSPTSSIYPIQDAIAERRLYFSMLGLLLIVVDFLGRVKLDRRKLAYACAAVALVAAIGTHARAAVWSDPVRLWEDTAAKSPDKFRARFQLGFAYYQNQQFDRAVAEFQKASTLQARGPIERTNLLVDWGLALDGLNRWSEGIDKLREAANGDPSAHIYSQIGMIYAKHNEFPPALEALDRAQKLDPGFTMTYVYRGQIYELMHDPATAEREYRHALELDANNDPARQGLLRLRSRPPGGQGR
jgi:tetratricopeptide (TPR) repeat protein